MKQLEIKSNISMTVFIVILVFPFAKIKFVKEDLTKHSTISNLISDNSSY